jgi:hypothetical protein
MKVTFIDPPSGWKYGFPKMIPTGTLDVRAWLIENGYPKEEMDALGDYFHCRYWERDTEEITGEEYALSEFENVGDEGLFPNHSDKDIWVAGFKAGYEFAKEKFQKKTNIV